MYYKMYNFIILHVIIFNIVYQNKIVVDHQIFKMFNVAHLLEKVDDPLPLLEYTKKNYIQQEKIKLKTYK